MNKDYKKYSAEDFAQDIGFINWVKLGENDKFWSLFIEQNPQLTKETDTAIEIIKSFSFKTISSSVPDLEILSKLEKVYNNPKPVRKLQFLSVLKYAAALALLMSLSITAYYFISKEINQEIQYSDLDFSIPQSESIQLKLADGKKIDLSAKSKQIQVNATTSSITVDNQNSLDNKSSHGLSEISTPYGTRLNVILPDGTNVWLNSNSKLIFPQQFKGESRRVFLQGEAYFKVRKDVNRPFVVNANQLNVIVLGTEFNINNRVVNNKLEVVLVEGSVKINYNEKKSNTLQLVPSQKMIFDKMLSTSTVESNVDVNFYTSWKDGYLVFKKQNIRDVLNVLSQYYNVHFVTGSRIDINRNITGKLELKESFKDVMQVMSDLAFINYTITGNNVEVTSIYKN